MAITDELRKWAHGLNTYNRNELQVLAIADRIDTVYERGMEERADRYSELRAKMNNCCIELPKDADGEPIHVGDWMTPNGMDMDFKVRQMHFNGEWSLDLEGFGISWTCPDMCRHRHAPTVEDTLRELIGKALMLSEVDGENELVAEYAKLLRLRGDAE